MKATIKTTHQVITGRSLRALKAQLDGMLKVSGPRGLTAITDRGTTIHVELVDGQDYVRTADGRSLSWGGSRPGAGPKPRLSLADRAAQRVDRSAQLAPHRDFILADWPEGDAHLRWVLSASVREILEWVAARAY